MTIGPNRRRVELVTVRTKVLERAGSAAFQTYKVILGKQIRVYLIQGPING